MDSVIESQSFTAEDLKKLLAWKEHPCVSIYIPTHRRRMEARPDAILFRNLRRDVERILARDVPGPIAREISSKLDSLDREDFWENGTGNDGLAVFAAPGLFSTYRLPGKFPELQVVGATFHTKPLMRFLQSSSLAYHVLSLNLHRVTLHEGFGDSIREVPVRLPQSPEAEAPEPPPKGHRDRQDKRRPDAGEEAKVDVEKFFRAIARDLWKNHLRGTTKPLILAAPAQHQPIFRRVAQIQTLLETGIVADPSKLSPDDLKAEARRVLEPELQKRVAKAREEFGLALSRGHGSDDLKTVAGSVARGRVKLLFVESGRRIWGMLSPETGEILPGDPSRNAYDVDLLDEMAEITLSRGGEVYVLRGDEMPTPKGIGAIFRF